VRNHKTLCAAFTVVKCVFTDKEVHSTVNLTGICWLPPGPIVPPSSSVFCLGILSQEYGLGFHSIPVVKPVNTFPSPAPTDWPSGEHVT
jgi:hypothetical protein